MEFNNIIAPFVMKTYQMVNDPTTDTMITWGRANNSFIVTDPLDFSRRILPAYFKHSNFSSFVRQLNTYGFRKVDPDKWEFANEWFLRGQNGLLKNIVRRKHNRSSSYMQAKDEEFDDEEIFMEIARLKEEQKALEDELRGMNERLEVTERRPQQTMAVLCKVVEDPELLPRLMLEKGRSKQLGSEKKRRFIKTTSSSSSGTVASSSVKSEEEEDGTFQGVISSPESDFHIENLYRSLPETNPPGWVVGRPRIFQEPYSCAAVPVSISSAYDAGIGSSTAVPENYISGYDNSGRQLGYFTEMEVGLDPPPPPPYPFSLLGGGF